MKARFTVALMLTAGLALSACSGETTSTSSASGSSALGKREAASSFTNPFSVENQLKDWWAGQGITVTWKVSETDNSDWDGNSRPDHAPPNGLQGLVQETFSGPYNVNLESNGARFSHNSRFVLTPVITIDGQAIDLQPIIAFSGETLATADSSCRMTTGSSNSSTASLSEKTPKGLLMYDVVLNCSPKGPSPGQFILIRNYQKS
jgi:hypothetical protein